MFSLFPVAISMQTILSRIHGYETLQHMENLAVTQLPESRSRNRPASLAALIAAASVWQHIRDQVTLVVCLNLLNAPRLQPNLCRPQPITHIGAVADCIPHAQQIRPCAANTDIFSPRMLWRIVRWKLSLI